jgi:hypothetical protein
MSDVLIIAKESKAVTWLRDALTRKGYSVATADDLVSALPELYLSPQAMRVYVGEETENGGSTIADALNLVAADSGPLGRHAYCAQELDVEEIAATHP